MIRRAEIKEAQTLTDISFAAKRYWDYPENYYDIWRDELTITAEYILENQVFVALQSNQVVGFYSLVELKHDLQLDFVTLHRGLWLDHMFLSPEYIGQGIGSSFHNHLCESAKEMGYTIVKTLADPNATGFYTKLGWHHKNDYASTIENRTTPYLEFHL